MVVIRKTLAEPSRGVLVYVLGTIPVVCLTIGLLANPGWVYLNGMIVGSMVCLSWVLSSQSGRRCPECARRITYVLGTDPYEFDCGRCGIRWCTHISEKGVKFVEPGCCELCGYRLQGLPEARCPECGTGLERGKDDTMQPRSGDLGGQSGGVDQKPEDNGVQ